MNELTQIEVSQLCHHEAIIEHGPMMYQYWIPFRAEWNDGKNRAIGTLAFEQSEQITFHDLPILHQRIREQYHLPADAIVSIRNVIAFKADGTL